VLKNVKNGTDDRSDRDSSFDRLLAGALAARSAAGADAHSAAGDQAARGALVPGAGCLDADTLAAWADDSLGRAARTAAEAHAADCGRCQALLAAMVKTAPAPVATKTFWRLPALGWLIPVTAATAGAIIIWAIVPGRAPLEPSDRAVSARAVGGASEAGRFAAAAPAPAGGPAAGRLEQEKAQAEGRPGPANESTRLKRDAAAPIPAAAAAAPPAAAAPLAAARAALHGARADKQNAAATEELAKTYADVQRESDDKKLPVSVDANARSTAIVGGRASAPAPRTETQTLAPSSAREAVSVRPFARTLDAAAGTVIVSPDPASRWRVVPGRPGSAVQRSTDGGSTWQTQETGALLTLTAGASPSPSVCWLVGPAGTVLLSTDGRSWQRLAFPEAVNLVSVTATDGKTATITASDGRRFSTTDGGLTWARSAS
jgi:hypothetical protein